MLHRLFGEDPETGWTGAAPFCQTAGRMRDFQGKAFRGAVVAVAVVAFAAAGCGGGGDEPAATEPPASEPAAGDVANGASVFESAGCGGCHTLEAAGSSGTSGPDLDDLQPSAEAVAAQVENGGGGMPAFSGQLSEQEIADVAAYVADATSG